MATSVSVLVAEAAGTPCIGLRSHRHGCKARTAGAIPVDCDDHDDAAVVPPGRQSTRVALVSPIGQLPDELNEKPASAIRARPTWLLPDHPNNEIGELVRRIDAFARRPRVYPVKPFRGDVVELRTRHSHSVPLRCWKFIPNAGGLFAVS